MQIFLSLAITIAIILLLWIVYLIIFLYKNRLSMRVGLFLAVKTLKRSSKTMTFSIIFVMMFAFFSLMVISGIMSGLIQGSINTFREKSLGDVIISPLDKESYIKNTQEFYKILDSDDNIKGYSYRYETSGTIEANWKTLGSNDTPNKRSVQFAGIDPVLENNTTKLSENIKEGSYLTKDDAGKYIMVGKDMVKKYSVVSDVDETLLRIQAGDKVKINIKDSEVEYIVKGIIVIKNQDVGSKVFMLDTDLRKLANLSPSQISLVAIRAKDTKDSDIIKDNITNSGLSQYAKVQTFTEGTPAFVINMRDLFSLLGSIFGIVGFLVAAITLFIVVFISAITRRKQIGILKGIGINGFAIEFSYVIQAILYAIIGCTIGAILVFFVVKPIIDANPIDFPFSDGIIVAELSTTIIRILSLTIISMFAGYIPAHMIVKRNTLDAILGR